MALSDYEQRRLEEIERGLHNDDPGFADSINISVLRRHGRLVAAAVFVVGVLVLAGGAVLAADLLLVGVAVAVLGFLAMVAGAGLFASRQPGPGRHAGDRGAHPGSTRLRIEDRFRRRFENPDH